MSGKPVMLLLLVAVTSVAAKKQELAVELDFFEKEIRSILVERCYECHSAEGKTKGGLRLDTKKGVRSGGDSGVAIVPGEPEASLLVEAIRYQNRDLQMPPKNPLPKREVAALEKWIQLGAPDPRVEEAMAQNVTAGMSLEEGRKFWSFQPVSKPQAPKVLHTSRVKNPIDAFVLSKLEKKGFQPAPPADKYTLIRRVTQDLIGLPPTAEEIQGFLKDESPEAFNKVVDRLLASPQYGVRWGRHWLDVARYADSNGLDENLGYGQAWRYRDYVIDSFNADKPYDRFLIEQIAGDLLPSANQETKTATGFLALGAKVLAEPDKKKLEMDIIDEQLDTIGKAFLGMTLGCVRCHDHKFDPIQQKEYYSLAAIFKSTRTLSDQKRGNIKYWYEHSFSTEEEQARIKKVDEELSKLKKAASSFKNTKIIKLRGEARSNAAEYLVAAAKFNTSTTLAEVTEIAKPKGLHPRILYHCRLHLDYNREDPVFQKWHQLAAKGDTEGIHQHYHKLFEAVQAAFIKLRKTDPKARKLDDPRLEAARVALHDNAGFLAVPKVDAFAFDAETLAEYYRLMSEARKFETKAPDFTAAMGVSDGETVPQLAVHIRGSYKNLGEPVKRSFPEVLQYSNVPPVFPDKGSGRLELARWMADIRHPLTARVMVNRVWGWHFGQPLVSTTENFGKLGERPSHPLLLDWLARNFMENGWSLKHLHKLILTSSVYQMDSNHPDAAQYMETDPENRWLWKANLRRLEAEQIRDAILAVSGRLDTTLGGKTLPLRNRQFVFNHTSEDHTKYDSLRRAVYLPVIRNHLYSFFEQFDYPDPTMPTGIRNSTSIPTQALVLMNSGLVMDAAEALAKQVHCSSGNLEQQVHQVYGKIFGRKPTSPEIQRAMNFLQTLDDSKQAWALFCQGLLASNEFIYVR